MLWIFRSEGQGRASPHQILVINYFLPYLSAIHPEDIHSLGSFRRLATREVVDVADGVVISCFGR